MQASAHGSCSWAAFMRAAGPVKQQMPLPQPLGGSQCSCWDATDAAQPRVWRAQLAGAPTAAAGAPGRVGGRAVRRQRCSLNSSAAAPFSYAEQRVGAHAVAVHMCSGACGSFLSGKCRWGCCHKSLPGICKVFPPVGAAVCAASRGGTHTVVRRRSACPASVPLVPRAVALCPAG